MGRLGEVLYRIGDQRWADLPAEAVALLEPLPPGPELVSALTDLARAESLKGKSEAGVRHAEQALALAGELGLARPARTLGYRGLARCDLGDRAGLEDFRDAIALATEAGQGREAGVMYGNFGETLWAFEGAAPALEVMRSGIAFAQDRGLAEVVNYTTGSTLDPLFGHGAFDEALVVAAGIVERYENADITAQVNARAAQGRILTLRGQAPQVAGSLDWLESTARGAARPSTPSSASQRPLLRALHWERTKPRRRCSPRFSRRREPARSSTTGSTSPRWSAPPWGSAIGRSPNASRTATSRPCRSPPIQASR